MTPREPTERPNIILINCDDLGYGDLGCYGSPINTSPHLDRMAAEGVRLTDFYMAAPLCSPSRGAMMTGCYAPRIGFGSFDGRGVLFPGMAVGLDPSEHTVASILKDRGYATMLVGKWHCGDQPEFLPTRHGFDHYFGIPYSNDMGRQRTSCPDRWPPLPLLRDEQVIQAQFEQESLTERYADEAVRFVRDNAGQPFFLYLAHMHVHRPILVSPRFAGHPNGRYGGAVEAIDWVTGVLMHELRQLGLDDNTLVVFTSDNGSRADLGGSNAPLRGRKGSTWEGGQRVCCIARWPGQIPAGTTCSELATAMDFLPTFARLAGAREPDDRVIDGKDISALLRGETGAVTPHEEFFYYGGDQLEAVRVGPWKLHVHKGKDAIIELYNLADDISEATDLAAAHPEIVADLRARIDRCRTQLGDSVQGVEGSACRPLGRVENPQPLTNYDPNCPYICAEYDTAEAG